MPNYQLGAFFGCYSNIVLRSTIKLPASTLDMAIGVGSNHHTEFVIKLRTVRLGNCAPGPPCTNGIEPSGLFKRNKK